MVYLSSTACPWRGGAAPTKLNGTLVSGGDVSVNPRTSPDSSRVVYQADQDADEVFELYSNTLDDTPEEGIANLKDDIQALVPGTLKPGQANGLTRPLDNALRSLDKGKTASACNQLQDFINKVNEKTPTPLDAGTAATLIADAEAIRTSLGC